MFNKFQGFIRFLLFLLCSTLLATCVHFFLDYAHLKEIGLFEISLVVAGIIGGSIAIMFSFAIFSLQRIGDLFSMYYLQIFVKDSKKTLIFWLLVSSMFVSLFTPVFCHEDLKFGFAWLLITLLGAFFLIYEMYIDLRKSVVPTYVIETIRKDAIKHLEKIKKTGALSQEKEFEERAESVGLIIIKHINSLHGIGMKLFTKGEIHSCEEILYSIHDIYKEILKLNDDSPLNFEASAFEWTNMDSFQFENDAVKNLANLSANKSVLLISLNNHLLSLGRCATEHSSVRSYLLTYGSILENILSAEYDNESTNQYVLLESTFISFADFVDHVFSLKDNIMNQMVLFVLVVLLNIIMSKAKVSHESAFNVFDAMSKLLKNAKMHYSDHPEVGNAFDSAISELNKRKNGLLSSQPHGQLPTPTL